MDISLDQQAATQVKTVFDNCETAQGLKAGLDRRYAELRGEFGSSNLIDCHKSLAVKEKALSDWGRRNKIRKVMYVVAVVFCALASLAVATGAVVMALPLSFPIAVFVGLGALAAATVTFIALLGIAHLAFRVSYKPYPGDKVGSEKSTRVLKLLNEYSRHTKKIDVFCEPVGREDERLHAWRRVCDLYFFEGKKRLNATYDPNSHIIAAFEDRVLFRPWEKEDSFNGPFDSNCGWSNLFVKAKQEVTR